MLERLCCHLGNIQGYFISGQHKYNAIDGDYGLDYLFPQNTGKVKADWYTGELQIPIGNRLYQECMEDPVYDSDWFIIIKKGKVIKQQYKANY